MLQQRVGGFLRGDNGIALLLLAILCWSGNFIIARATAGIVPPVALAFFRWFFAALIVGAIYWPQIRRDWPVILRHWQWILLLGICGIGIYNTFIYVGLQSTIVLNLLVLNSSMTFMIAVMGFLFFAERLGGRQIFGILLSVVGVLWIVLGGDLSTIRDFRFNEGDIWILMGVLSYAIYTVFLRKVPKIHPMSFIGVIFVIGTIMNLPFLIYEMSEGRVVPWSNPQAVVSIAYVVLFPSILAYICFNRGVAVLGATRAATIMLITPVLGAVLAMIVLGERLTVVHLVGGLLVFTGIFVSRTKKNTEKA